MCGKARKETKLLLSSEFAELMKETGKKIGNQCDVVRLLVQTRMVSEGFLEGDESLEDAGVWGE